MMNNRVFHKAGRKFVHIATAALLTATTCVASTAQAADNGRSWRVSDIKGQALSKSQDGNWKMLKRGDVVQPGAEVKTGEKGRLILVRPGDSLDVAPNSAFNVPNGQKLSAGGPATHIDQSKGTILFKITTRPENPFTVKTPYLAAVIKGTTFTVSVDANDAALHVSKGAVQVSSILTGQTALVRPGQTAAVSRNNGGAMRLMGFQRQGSNGSPQGGTQGGSPIEKSESGGTPGNSGNAAGRGQVKSVIPTTVGERTVNIGKVSKGLVSGNPRPQAPGRGNGAGNKGGAANGLGNERKSSPVFKNAVTTSVRETVNGGNGIAVISRGVGNSMTNNGGGNANGNANGNGNGNGNGNANGKKN